MVFIAVHLVFLLAYATLAWSLGAAALELLDRFDRRFFRSERMPAPGGERLVDEPQVGLAGLDGSRILPGTVLGTVLAAALGTGLLGQLVFVVAWLGWLSPGPTIAILVVAWAGSLWLVRSALGRMVRRFGRRRARRPWPRISGLAAVGLPGLALCLYPPTGFDVGMYHLPFVARFLEASGLVFVTELRYPIFPQLAEMGFALAMLLVDDVAPALTQWFAWALVAGMLWCWPGGEDEGDRVPVEPAPGNAPAPRATSSWATLNRAASLWAAALWAGTPLAVWIGARAYVDIGLALYTTGAILAWERWRRSRSGRSDFRWLILSGAFVGLAAGTKYLGLFFLGVLGLATALAPLLDTAKARPRRAGGWFRFRARERPLDAPSSASGSRAGSAWRAAWRAARRGFGHGALFALAALVFAGPWYGRIFLATGNPVFPFYTPLFGDNDWRHVHDDLLAGSDEAATPGAGSFVASSVAIVSGQVVRAASGLVDLVRTPWQSYFERHRFHRQAPLHPAWILLWPWFLLPALRSGPGAWRLALVALYSLFWLTTERDLRFLVPILPLASLCSGQGLAWTVGTAARAVGAEGLVGRRWVAWLFAGLLVAPGPGYALYKLGQQGPLPSTSEMREAYLARQLAGYAELAEVGRRSGLRGARQVPGTGPKVQVPGTGPEAQVPGTRIETPTGPTVYGLYAENLHYHAPGPFRGDWFGPFAYERVVRFLDDPEALHRELRSMGAEYWLVRITGTPSARLPADEVLAPRFRRLEVPAPPAGSRASEIGFALYELGEFDSPRGDPGQVAGEGDQR